MYDCWVTVPLEMVLSRRGTVLFWDCDVNVVTWVVHWTLTINCAIVWGFGGWCSVRWNAAVMYTDWNVCLEVPGVAAWLCGVVIGACRCQVSIWRRSQWPNCALYAQIWSMHWSIMAVLARRSSVCSTYCLHLLRSPSPPRNLRMLFISPVP